MKLKKSYIFNRDTLSFVELRWSWLNYAKRGLLFIFAAPFFLSAYYMLFSFFVSTPEERNLMKIKETMKRHYTASLQRYRELDEVVAGLEERDANIYRYIFDTDPPEANASEDDDFIEKFEELSNSVIVRDTRNSITMLQKTAEQQTQRLKDIAAACLNNPTIQNLPTIQPVEDRDFRYIAATYGSRMHPFYKVLKMHAGIDFSSPLGSNVRATAAGKVSRIERNYRNSGLSVLIDHGGGYQTRYNHLGDVLVAANQVVKRTQVIGTVGNSGRSVAPHLHYEILKNGNPCNPIHYFFGNIMPADYQMLKILEANKGQSLD
jgi:murein DD-endopeptidase MepM/ murein hydrolase activator NlpD